MEPIPVRQLMNGETLSCIPSRLELMDRTKANRDSWR